MRGVERAQELLDDGQHALGGGGAFGGDDARERVTIEHLHDEEGDVPVTLEVEDAQDVGVADRAKQEGFLAQPAERARVVVRAIRLEDLDGDVALLLRVRRGEHGAVTARTQLARELVSLRQSIAWPHAERRDIW